MGLARGRSRSLRDGGGAVYTAEANALFARMTTPPSPERKSLINATISSLLASGVWGKMDALYMLAAADSQAARLNWISDQYNASAINTPSFTVDRGYTGNGSSAYLDSLFNPFTASGAKYIQDSAHISIWDLTNRAAKAVSIETGIFNGSTFQTHINARYTGDVALGRVNQGVTGAMQPAVTSSNGYYVISRTGATAQAYYKNGALLVSSTVASVSLASANASLPFLAGKNVGGSAVSFSTDQLAAATIGGGLTASDQSSLYAAIGTYLTAIGAT